MRLPGRAELLRVLKEADRPLTHDEVAERLWHVRPLYWRRCLDTAIHYLRKKGFRIERDRTVYLKESRR